MQTEMSLTFTIRRTSSIQTFLKTRGLCLKQSWPLTKKMSAAYQRPHRNWCTKNIFMAFTDSSAKRRKMKRRKLKQHNYIRNFNKLLWLLCSFSPFIAYKSLRWFFMNPLVTNIEWIKTKFWGICLQLTSIVSRKFDYHLRFLGNWSPSPPLSNNFALSEKQVLMST